MADRKKVSVIIPVYNVEKYLEKCLDSVERQTLPEIEIICVNDGSTDGSLQILQSYAEKDDRIIIINKENGGLSSARNAGLAVAEGEYVYFLDSDDWILAETLEVLYDECKKENLDTILFDADSIFETEEVERLHPSYRDYYHREDCFGNTVTGQRLFAEMMPREQYRSSACLQMNRRAFLEQYGLGFREGMIHEDELFTLQVSLRAERAKHLARPFYQRLVREESIMTSVRAIRSAFGYYVCNQLILAEATELVKEKDIMDIYVNKISRLRRSIKSALKDVKRGEIDRFTSNRLEDMALLEQFKYEQRLVISNRNLRKKIQELRASTTFKVGKTVTFIPRKLKSAYRVLKKKGIKELYKAILYKIAPGYYAKKYVEISIIMPVYNGEKYLWRCIRSLQKQMFRDIEIICVDDKSTDRSMELLQERARHDKRVRILQQEHLGAGSARNLGMKEARGKYLLFLDCDDLFDKNMCRELYRAAEKHDAQVVLFGAQRMDMMNNRTERMGWVLRSSELPKDAVFSGQEIADRLFQITSNCPWSKMFRRDFILENGLEFQSTRHCNDAYFVRMAMALAERMTMVDQIFTTYRFNMGASTQGVKHEAPLEFYKAFSAVKEALTEKGLFALYKKSFVNWTLTESLFNYRTMKTAEAKAAIKEKMLTEGFDYFGITECSPEDIYNPQLYEEYLEFRKG
ncbi:hypothetical protein BRYFOR_07392 [Marvinbryantia formatexigens DSM 14469]|uniref:Glycosyltransferase 2-like domain-containing protein n=1 Tax=Marvinbryantia formatexigens DSM 14469 TaxID=478749 RepID=C6LFI9_9FIRM|nr:glycosyltransferase family 2 protein [Marvinbryantia formatexigens]EET60574.1 hypothetical protein BRYFOR_07392 [Marvinbryantia formatexigens DSM 14469]UWO25569.1 glycosyltransferase [Marvinbryantia formatexigens DSM 14469]SDG19413.1 Glycosyltransferase involved in cell wall bisynthesis [Marvinbryantia formatexigens]